MDRVLKVVRGPGEDVEDGLQVCVRLCPAMAYCQGAVGPDIGSAMFASEVTRKKVGRQDWRAAIAQKADRRPLTEASRP